MQICRLVHLVQKRADGYSLKTATVRMVILAAYEDSNSEDGDSGSIVRSTSKRDIILDEIQRYKSIPTAEDDPLEWWKCNGKTFPVLSILAARFLQIPATSVPCERLFSMAGHVCSKKRSTLSPDMLQTLLLLHDWQQ